MILRRSLIMFLLLISSTPAWAEPEKAVSPDARAVIKAHAKWVVEIEYRLKTLEAAVKKASVRDCLDLQTAQIVKVTLASPDTPCPEIIPIQGVVGLNAPHEIEVALTGSVGLQALSVTGRIESPGMGSSTAASPAYVGALMATFSSDRNLTATQNIPFAILGKYQHTGADSTNYLGAAVVGELGDGVTAASYSVMATVGGDTTATTGTAAFGVDWQTSTPASLYSWGIDFQGEGAHDGYLAPRYNRAFGRLGGRTLNANDLDLFTVSGICWPAVVNAAPVDGTSGTRANQCGPGSLLIRMDNGTLFQNTGTLASPTWTTR